MTLDDEQWKRFEELSDKDIDSHFNGHPDLTSEEKAELEKFEAMMDTRDRYLIRSVSRGDLYEEIGIRSDENLARRR
jgi:hypothetical protein